MDKLWAPWRMKYIFENKTGDCIFCEKPAQKKDKENFILDRSSHSFSILNIYPYNNGHIMIVPYRHLGSFEDLSNEELLDISVSIRKWVSVIRKCMNPAGFNLGVNIGEVSGAGIADHVHAHIVPRWNADTNFMPVVADTKVLPQSLNEVYALLSEALKSHK